MQDFKWSSPLDWPLRQKRTAEQIRARFGRIGQSPNGSWKTKKQLTIGQAVQELVGELARMQCTEITISSNLVLKNDGAPRSVQKDPKDKGIAAHFLHRGKPFVIAVDRYDRIADNIKAVARTVSAYRQIERDGGPDILDSALFGMSRGLPAAGETVNSTGRNPWEIMGVKPGMFDNESLKTRWRSLSKKYHPDNQETANQEQYSLVQWAYKQLKQVAA